MSIHFPPTDKTGIRELTDLMKYLGEIAKNSRASAERFREREKARIQALNAYDALTHELGRDPSEMDFVLLRPEEYRLVAQILYPDEDEPYAVFSRKAKMSRPSGGVW